MLADYLKAAIPKPVTLLGQRLKALSRGHLLILLRHDCALVHSGEETDRRAPELGDLLLGVYVCCHTYEEALAALEELTPDKLKAWGEALEKQGGFNLGVKCREFVRYVGEGCGFPELVEGDKDDGFRTPGAPFLQKLGLFDLHHLHLSRSESLNRPLGEALHDWCAFWEWKGQLKIKGPDEEKMFTDPKALEIEASILREMGWTDAQIADYRKGNLTTEDTEQKGGDDAV